jgi:hypothetical protein
MEDVMRIGLGLDLLKANNSKEFIWCTVENKHGNIFKIGGRSTKEDFKIDMDLDVRLEDTLQIDLNVEIPVYENNNKPVTRSNGIMKNDYLLSVEIHGGKVINYENVEELVEDLINYNFFEGKPPTFVQAKKVFTTETKTIRLF